MFSNLPRFGLALALVLTLSASLAHAITYRFTAPTPDGPLVLTVRFSEPAVDVNPSPTLGGYAGSGVELLLESSSFTLHHTGAFDFAQTNVGNANLETLTILQVSGVTVTPPGAANPFIGLVVGGPNFLGGSAALPLALPSSIPQGGVGAISFEQPDGELFYGRIRRIEVNPPPVPEPVTAALAGASLLTLAVAALRRR